MILLSSHDDEAGGSLELERASKCGKFASATQQQQQQQKAGPFASAALGPSGWKTSAASPATSISCEPDVQVTGSNLLACASLLPLTSCARDVAVEEKEEDIGLQDIPNAEEQSKAHEAPVKRKRGRDPPTNKSPWTQEVVCSCYFLYGACVPACCTCCLIANSLLSAGRYAGD